MSLLPFSQRFPSPLDHPDATAHPAQNSNCPPAFAQLPDAPQDAISMGYPYLNRPLQLPFVPIPPPLQLQDMAIALYPTIPTPAAARSRSVATDADHDHNVLPIPDKDKKNPCWMCHKAFDRPSTLKKHMLVHTGEKPYPCDTCPRRFGVASNLNRHKRICPRRPDTARLIAGPSTALDSPTSVPERLSPSPSPTARTYMRHSDTIDRPRRNRRPQPPSLWIPNSLRFFDLTPIPRSVPVPLPPMDSFANEEHSLFFDAHHMLDMPYHPKGWKGYLPGPAVTADVAMGPTAGGRILVF